MHASSLSILSKHFITDKIITQASPVLDFTLLILRSVYTIKIILMRKIPNTPKIIFCSVNEFVQLTML